MLVILSNPECMSKIKLEDDIIISPQEDCRIRVNIGMTELAPQNARKANKTSKHRRIIMEKTT